MTIIRALTLDNLPGLHTIRDAVIGRRIETVRYLVILDSDSWRDEDTNGEVHQIEAVILGLTGGMTLWCTWGTPPMEGISLALGEIPAVRTFDVVEPVDQLGWRDRIWKKIVDLRVGWYQPVGPQYPEALWATTLVLDRAESVTFALGSWHVTERSLTYDATSLAVLFGESVANAYRPDGEMSAWGVSLSDEPRG